MKESGQTTDHHNCGTTIAANHYQRMVHERTTVCQVLNYRTCPLCIKCIGDMQAVLKMLDEIGSVENIPSFIEGVKNR